MAAHASGGLSGAKAAMGDVVHTVMDKSSGMIKSTISHKGPLMDIGQLTGIKNELRYMASQINLAGEKIGVGLVLGLAAMGFCIGLGAVGAAFVKHRGGLPASLESMCEPPCVDAEAKGGDSEQGTGRRADGATSRRGDWATGTSAPSTASESGAAAGGGGARGNQHHPLVVGAAGAVLGAAVAHACCTRR